MAKGEVRALVFADGVSVSAASDTPMVQPIDFAWTLAATYMLVDVSAYVTDARQYNWRLSKPSGNNYEQVDVKITKPDANTVRLDAGDFALDPGTYRLNGA